MRSNREKILWVRKRGLIHINPINNWAGTMPEKEKKKAQNLNI